MSGYEPVVTYEGKLLHSLTDEELARAINEYYDPKNFLFLMASTNVPDGTALLREQARRSK